MVRISSKRDDEMARYLGLDLGTRTLGMALSDATGLIATTYKTVRYPEGQFDFLLEEVKKVVLEYPITTIVLGLPKNMNNSIGESAKRTLKFGKQLEEYLNIEVVYQDERLTTVEATNYMLDADLSRKKRKEKIDSLAASIILQTYLDRKRKENE